MTDLIQQIEEATGPDREIDVAIWVALVADDKSKAAYEEGQKISAKEAAFRADYMMGGARYTASIDAAMTIGDEATMAQALREAFSMVSARGWPEGDFVGALARETVAAALRASQGVG